MLVSNRHVPRDSHIPPAAESTTDKTIALLNELLTHTLAVRDLYKSARCQAADIHVRHLRPLFDTHYQEQLRLVDVLVDRIRVLGGANRVLAGTFLQGTLPSYAARGQSASKRLLCDLLDNHELVLSMTRTAGTHRKQPEPSAVHDFAVGQVVLANELQGYSVQEQLVNLDRERRFANANFRGVEAYE